MSLNTPNSGSGKGRITEEARKPSAPSDAEILRKCMEDNNGDKSKCKSQINAFKSAASSPPTPKPPASSRLLRSGSLTDV